MVSRMTRTLVAVLVLAGVLFPVSALGQDKPTAARPSERDQLGGFHLVLMLADNKAGPPVEGVTPNVARALKDVQQLLPFKSYRLLDAALVRGSNGTTRISGPDGSQYVLVISGRNAGPGAPVEVDISLRDQNYYVTNTGANQQRPPAVLNSSFRMSVGETIVAGTSKLAGSDQALVVVLTALPDSALHQQ